MVTALVPARGGSTGLPGKNVRPLGGHPLVAYSIAAAQLTARIDRIVVSTDSEHIAAIGRHYGAEVPFLRPTAFAADRSPDREFVVHALDWFQRSEGAVPDYIVHLRPTTPLRDPALVDAALVAMDGRADATSLRSAHAVPESPLKWFVRDAQGYFTGFDPNSASADSANRPRQDFPPVYVPNGYVDVLRTAHVVHANDLHGPRLLGYVTPVSHEVDTLEDFEFIEFQLARTRSLLLDHLNKHYAPWA